MHVVGQHNPSINCKRPLGPCGPHRLPQRLDLSHRVLDLDIELGGDLLIGADLGDQILGQLLQPLQLQLQTHQHWWQKFLR